MHFPSLLTFSVGSTGGVTDPDTAGECGGTFKIHLEGGEKKTQFSPNDSKRNNNDKSTTAKGVNAD